MLINILYKIIIVRIFIFKEINYKKILIMGCGCKNKGTQVESQQSQPTPTQLQTLQQVQNQQSIQESVNKVVEKYYKK